jgi:arginine decarboxylase
VIGRKKTNESFVWALLNTRLMEAIPEYYMCGEPMKFVPVNNIDAKMEKAKLAGITCDCDDVYAEDENFVMIPEKQKEKQIIAILGTGSYQESLTSQASVRHCLIPAEKRIVSFIQNGERKFLEVEQEQSAQNVFDLTKLNKKYLEQFS